MDKKEKKGELDQAAQLALALACSFGEWRQERRGRWRPVGSSGSSTVKILGLTSQTREICLPPLSLHTILHMWADFSLYVGLFAKMLIVFLFWIGQQHRFCWAWTMYIFLGSHCFPTGSFYPFFFIFICLFIFIFFLFHDSFFTLFHFCYLFLFLVSLFQGYLNFSSLLGAH